MSDEDLSNALAWIVSETGVGDSSKTIWATMMGVPGRKATPWDGDDFSRCYRLFSIIPSWNDRLEELRSVSPVWNALVSNWSRLCDAYEAGNYGLLNAILNGCNAAPSTRQEDRTSNGK
jgi:hypothetical protein